MKLGSAFFGSLEMIATPVFEIISSAIVECRTDYEMQFREGGSC